MYSLDVVLFHGQILHLMNVRRSLVKYTASGTDFQFVVYGFFIAGFKRMRLVALPINPSIAYGIYRYVLYLLKTK